MFGFVYILFAMWIGSAVAHAVAYWTMSGPHEVAEFVKDTMENWQSEFLQLFVQAIGMVVVAHVIFRKSVEESERVEAKIDRCLARLGEDPDAG